jgi:LacI family transcriptional regulator, repressor for deo operon, udp, cdd, tsx, nupC, and nupG
MWRREARDVAAPAGGEYRGGGGARRRLHGDGKLRPDTLARVAEAVRRTGYTPNLPARMLRAQRTMMVLVVVPDIANPFFSDVLRGIDETLSVHGYGLLIGSLGHDRGKEAQIVDLVQAGQVDGVLLLNGRIPERSGRSLGETGIDMVALCEAIPGAPFPQVDVDNRGGARAAVAHLVGLGHRRLGYIGGPAANILERERRAGFCDGLRAARLARSSAQFWPGDFRFATGQDAADAWLALASRPTGVFAANDEMAIGFIKRVRAAGISVPGDVSVIGFDGIDFADYVEPVLTTFRQPRRALGRAGAGLLMRLLAGEAIPAEDAQIRLSVTLLDRDSAGPRPG